jgi:photosystem II stability/assembly factor-like uncharacterized protein
MNPDVAYVAAVGHLWGANPERGVYKTTDGGATWDLVLFVDEHTGAIDLAMDPGDPQTLFAAMYQRRRTNFGFNGGGAGSGIYRTLDGGASWDRLENGLPEGDMGRIGLDIHRRDGSLVYAVVEARGAAQGVYRSTNRGESWEQMSDENPRPMYFSQIRIDPNDPERIYLGGVQLHISRDGGRTFTREAREVHSDHHALWIDPNDSDHLIMGSDGGVAVSFDRAERWRMYDNIALGQFYEIGVDMRDPYYVCGGLQDNGSWCGPSETYTDEGIMNKDWYNVHGGDGFYTQIDPTDPRVMYAESQNGRPSRVDVLTGERQSIQPQLRTDDDDEEYRWNWNTPIVLSRHDPGTVYYGANVLLKSTDRGYTWTPISPDLTKAIDRSELEIMGALPNDDMLSRHDGISSFGNITTVSESPMDANVVYVGTDDGNVQVTRDGGATWTDATGNIPGVPAGTYVSRVVASAHDAGTVYATFDGHTNDDYAAYVYVSSDYGRRWTSITNGLPDKWSVNVLAEHPRNRHLLFVGNEVGVYVSLDRGGQWTRMPNLPTVPVDDIVIHPRDNDLVLGTHGRSIWIMDDILPLEQISSEVLAADLHVFGNTRPARIVNVSSPQGWVPGAYAQPNPDPGARIRYYLAEDAGTGETMASAGTNGDDGESPPARIDVLDASGTVLRTLEGKATAGLHEVVWDFRVESPTPDDDESGGGGGFFGGPQRGPRVLPGTYTAVITAGDDEARIEVSVEGDPRIEISSADLAARQDALMSLHALAGPVATAQDEAEAAAEQLETVLGLLEKGGNAPADLAERVDTMRDSLDAMGREARRQGQAARRLFSAIERSTTRPTADQLWQIDRSWRRGTEMIERLNGALTTDLPALYADINRLGVGPGPAAKIPLPVKP